MVNCAMGRIRTIKPEFPQSESVGRLSRDARLLFILLWTIVDDKGRARAAPKLVAGQLYPFDDDARDLIEEWMSELETSLMIRRYEVDGTCYLDIPKFLEHQLINRPSESRLPEFIESSLKPHGSLTPRAGGPRSKILGPRSMVSNPRARKHNFPKDGFELLWSFYPHKKAKAVALKAYTAIVKRDDVSFEPIFHGLQKYVQETDNFWCHLSTWLNQKRWEDGEAGPISKPNGKMGWGETAMEITRDEESRDSSIGESANVLIALPAAKRG